MWTAKTDQIAHLHSLIKVFARHYMGSLVQRFLHVGSKDFDQIAQMHRLILTAPIAQWVECSREREVTSSIPGRDIPKLLKMVLAAPRLVLRLRG